MKYKIWPGTVQTIWQSDYLERRSGPWLEPCPRSRAVRGYFTADNGGDQKIKAYTQMYKTLPWNVGGHRVQLHLARAGTMTSYFHINLICLHHDQTGPVSDGGHQTVPGLTKAFLKVVVWKYCRVTAINLPQSMCNVWTF